MVTNVLPPFLWFTVYNVSVTLECPFFRCLGASPRGKTPEPICTLNGSKRVKSGKDVPFGGFVKNGHPIPLAPKFRKFCITKAVYRSKHASKQQKNDKNCSKLTLVRCDIGFDWIRMSINDDFRRSFIYFRHWRYMTSCAETVNTHCSISLEMGSWVKFGNEIKFAEWLDRINSVVINR